jgi:hypothetical protein
VQDEFSLHHPPFGRRTLACGHPFAHCTSIGRGLLCAEDDFSGLFKETIARMIGRDTDMKMAGPFRSGHFNF